MSCLGVIIMAKPNHGFKVGDEVKCIKSYEDVRRGMTGKVVHLWFNDWVGVEWKGLKGAHDCEGNAKDGAGFYLQYDYLELLDINLINE